MRFAELASGGAAPITGEYALAVTVTGGNVEALTFSTPIAVASATVEEFVYQLLRSLTRLQQANITTLAGRDGEVVALNGTNRAATFDPTAYQVSANAPLVDLSADIGQVTVTASPDEGGTAAIAVELVVDRDFAILESVPKVTLV
jgi:hypothetical protein